LARSIKSKINSKKLKNKKKDEKNKKYRKESWKGLEEMKKEGFVKEIGVSNYTINHLKELFEYCEIKPYLNQIEFHPKCYQKDLLNFCFENNIIVQVFKKNF
jgi:diketogulonate reductase-like aldo/keto reductase